MNFIQQILADYRKVERHVFYLVGAELCLQLINSCYFILLNYFMEAEGYQDYEITNFVKERFFAVMLFALPLGFFIKGKRLKPFFYIAAVTMPTMSLLVVYAISNHLDTLLIWCMRLWGLGFIFIHITALPFILLNVKKEQHSEAISMFFQTWSVAIFFVGIFNFILNYLNPSLFTEKTVILIFSALGFLSFYFVSRIKIKETISEALPIRKIKKLSDVFKAAHDIMVKPYDWGLILKAVIPTFIIALGAGFTIPVINLFFLHVHEVGSRTFSLLGASTYVLVAIGMTFMPYIRKRFGYKTAIILFQSLAVFALFIMATTEYYNTTSFAVYIAIFFYIIRQPLMNVAGPMTSELTMYYVGKRNQEMISALNSSIWSGNWFISLFLFTWFRQHEYRYVSIFMITVVLYVIGVLWYAYLIRDYENRLKS